MFDAVMGTAIIGVWIIIIRELRSNRKQQHLEQGRSNASNRHSGVHQTTVATKR